MTPEAKRHAVAFLGSLGVYLVPLIGPHAVWFLGELLVQELTRAGDREAWWLVTDLMLALTAQVAVGCTLAWSIRGSRLRLLAWIVVVPTLTVGLNLAYLVAIPSYFLIEPDTAPEVAGWEEHCFVPDVSLMSIRRSVNQPPEGAREWWVQRPDARYALLRLPDCVLVDAGLPVATVQPGGRVDFMLGFQFAAPGGAAALERLVPATSERTWLLLLDPASPLVPVESPELTEGAPILSDAADAVAWVQRVAGPPLPVRHRVLVRPLQPTAFFESVDIDLAPFGRASYTLLGVDTVRREVLVWGNRQPLAVGFDGQGRALDFDAGLVRAQASTYLRHRDGWVAWDAYRDTGPYHLFWSLASGSGSHRTNRGRSITAAAVDPTGRFIAMSESTTLNIGSARDVVYVIRTSDGTDAFRAYLPRYARSQVGFFEGALFGYSDLEGTHVLKVP